MLIMIACALLLAIPSICSAAVGPSVSSFRVQTNLAPLSRPRSSRRCVGVGAILLVLALAHAQQVLLYLDRAARRFGPAPGNYLMGFTALSGCTTATCIPACQQAFPAQCGAFTPTAPAVQACTANPTLATKSTPPAPVPFSAAASLMTTMRGAAMAVAAVVVAVVAQLAAF